VTAANDDVHVSDSIKIKYDLLDRIIIEFKKSNGNKKNLTRKINLTRKYLCDGGMSKEATDSFIKAALDRI